MSPFLHFCTVKFTFYIALRYLFSSKKKNIVQIISLLSGIAIAVVSGALIIVLSAFNGLESLVVSLFNSFDPDIKIVSVDGRMIENDSLILDMSKKLPGLTHRSRVVEDNVLFVYDGRQYIGTLKGVDNEFLGMTGLDTMMWDGEARLRGEQIPVPETMMQGEPLYEPLALAGLGVARSLGLDLSGIEGVQIFFPKRGKTDMLEPFRSRRIRVAGIFAIQQDLDNKYMIVPLEFADELLDTEGAIRSLELDFATEKDAELAEKELESKLSSDYKVLNKFEQHQLIYRIMRSEKLAVYLIVAFILLIASFNIFGALTMLMVEKQKDIQVLHSLGTDLRSIRRIFMLQGMMISMSGCLIGITIGTSICLIQLYTGIIRVNPHPDAMPYPVELNPFDFVLTAGTVCVIASVITWLRIRAITVDRIRSNNLLK
jgi:lipoprotein-releasing system permease protein